MRKKTEILKFRVDIGTLAALQRQCDETKLTLSELLRDMVASGLAAAGNDPGDGLIAPLWLVRPSGYLGADEHALCADLLATILTRRSIGLNQTDEMQQKNRRQILRLLNALFRALDEPTERKPFPAKPMDDFAIDRTHSGERVSEPA